MPGSRGWVWGAWLLAAAAPLGAQQEAPAKPWFVYLRDGGQSPFYGFVSYTFGKPFLMAGVLMDPPNNYREYLGGAGVNLFTASGNGAAIAALASDASDSWYLELYALPSVTAGRFNGTSFAGVYLPLETVGVGQLFLDPITVLYRAHPRVALGGSYTIYKIQGLPARQGAGPTLQLTVPSATITLDALTALRNFTRELRLTLQFIF